MPPRIVVFGATGYTGRKTAAALVARGERPVLAGRNAERLASLASDLGGLETAVADVADPPSVNELVDRGDVLVATVGPFVRFGRPAVEAAIDGGAHYVDSTGEPPFIREVFEHYGSGAARSGVALLTAMGYDWVPGNLAGALALERAGDEAVRVDTGYFITGEASVGGMSGGTRASTAANLSASAFAWRDGRIVTERSLRRLRTFSVDGEELPAVSVGTSEHFGLPRFAPQLREVNAYLGWFGRLARPMQAFSAMGAAVAAVPGARRLMDATTSRIVKGSTGGPDEQTLAKGGSHVVAIAYDEGGRELAEVHLVGVDGYTFTARLLGWAAAKIAAGGLQSSGALAPVEAFGLRELEAGVAEAGLAETGLTARAEPGLGRAT
ncbi:MAG: saccharopine dehydrogenase family protein [Solirubrobacterales bacterium]